MGPLTNFLANRKPPGINLDQLNLFEGKPLPSGLALMVPIDQLDEDPDNPRKAFPPEAIEPSGVFQDGMARHSHISLGYGQGSDGPTQYVEAVERTIGLMAG